MKTALAILAILPALLIPAYADVVQFPTLTTDGMVDYQLDTFYPTNSTYIIQISILYEVDLPIEVPEKITWYEIDGTAHIVYLQDDFGLIHYPTEDEQTISPDTGLTDADVEKILDEKGQELAEEDDSGFSKLRACLIEFEEEQPIRFAAWDRISDLQEFTIPDQWLNQDHYSRAELEAQKKWVICEALKKYPFVGVWESNKIIDVHVDKPQDTSDSPDTVDVTAELIRQEEIKAEAFQCSDQGKRQGLCKDYLAGEEYLIKKPRMPVWYGEYRDTYQDTPDLQAAVDVAMLTQCDEYYKLYKANSSIEIPTWLSHCEEQ